MMTARVLENADMAEARLTWSEIAGLNAAMRAIEGSGRRRFDPVFGRLGAGAPSRQ